MNFAKILRTPFYRTLPFDCYWHLENLTFKLLILNKFAHSINIVGTLYLMSRNIHFRISILQLSYQAQGPQAVFFIHTHQKKYCNFSAANFICGPIYVEFFIHVQQNAAITFEIMLELSIIKDGLKEKTSSLYCSAFTRWRGGSSKEKKSKLKHLGENVSSKEGWTRNLQQSLPRITRSKITQRLY